MFKIYKWKKESIPDGFNSITVTKGCYDNGWAAARIQRENNTGLYRAVVLVRREDFLEPHGSIGDKFRTVEDAKKASEIFLARVYSSRKEYRHT